jgi:hypothetical protein
MNLVWLAAIQLMLWGVRLIAANRIQDATLSKVIAENATRTLATISRANNAAARVDDSPSSVRDDPDNRDP